MGGQTVAIHIATTSIRIASGGFVNGKLVVQKTAFISDAAQFFADDKLLYLRELVARIVGTLREEKISVKKVVICYDNPEINVLWGDDTIVPEPKKESQLKTLLTKDFSFGRKKKGPSSVPVSRYHNGTISKQQNWGEYITHEKRGSMNSVTDVDRELISTFVSEFALYGYTVTSIESLESALMYLRHTLPYHYDSMAHLLLYVDEHKQYTKAYTFIKNVPSKMFPRPLSGAINDMALADELIVICKNEIMIDNLRRPIILLGGDAFKSYTTYETVVEALEAADLSVYDIYDYFTQDTSEAVDIKINGERNDPERCGLFTICLSLLCRSLDVKPENLIDGKKVKTVGATPMLSLGTLGLSMMVLLYSLITFGLISYDYYVASQAITTSYSTAQLEFATSKQATELDKLNATAWIDTRFRDILIFATTQNISGTLNIISIDSENMMAMPTASNSVFIDPEVIEEVPVLSMDVNGTDERIILRGFSSDSHAPMTVYGNLVSTMIGPIELVGIRQITLPNDEVGYIFEIAIEGVMR